MQSTTTPQAATAEKCPTESEISQNEALAFVGADRVSGVGMTDSEREAAIVRAGKAVEKHMEVWKRDGCFAARGDADRAMRLMYLLIAGRSPEQVARMQKERGLA